MPSIGNLSVNVHTVDRDEVVYITPDHTVSHENSVALRRTPSKGTESPLRTNMRFAEGFSTGVDKPQKEVVVSIAVTVPPGIEAAAVQTSIEAKLIQAAPTVARMAVTGDIHL